MKADTKAIQAIHEHVITHNPRVSVSHGDHTSWSLRIKGAQKEDEGLYMCQINTDPMKFQVIEFHRAAAYFASYTRSFVFLLSFALSSPQRDIRQL